MSRASVHIELLSEDWKLGIGDRITVYKANMIIYQIAENSPAAIRCPRRYLPGVRRGNEDRAGDDTSLCTAPIRTVMPKAEGFLHTIVSRDAMNIDSCRRLP